MISHAHLQTLAAFYISFLNFLNFQPTRRAGCSESHIMERVQFQQEQVSHLYECLRCTQMTILSAIDARRAEGPRPERSIHSSQFLR